jgi:hypothetical protein
MLRQHEGVWDRVPSSVATGMDGKLTQADAGTKGLLRPESSVEEAAKFKPSAPGHG